MANYLSLNAFDLTQNDLPDIPLYQMKFPQEWRSFLRQFMENEYAPVKLEKLRIKLQALFPQILAGYDNQLTNEQNQPWLIATEPISEVWLERLAINWLKNELSKKTKLADKIQQIPKPTLIWKKYDLPEEWDNCTCYQVIPGLYAHVFCRESRILKLSGDEEEIIPLEFAHVYYGKDHECMSLPLQDKRRKFSYVVRFNVTHRGGQAERFLLNVKIGMRRFQTKPIMVARNPQDLLFGKKGTLLFAITNPFIKSRNYPKSLSALKFKRSRDGSGTMAEWESAEEKLFFDVLKNNLTVDKFLADPMVYWQGAEGIQGLLVYSSQVYRKEPGIKSGLGLPERMALLDLVRSALNLQARLEHLAEVPTRSKGKGLQLPIQTEKKMHINLEFWMSQALYEECVNILRTQIQDKLEEGRTLLLPTESAEVFVLNANQEVTVNLHHQNQPFLTQCLDSEGLAIQRIHDISSRILPSSRKNLTLALVEIGEKGSYGPHLDPKLAVRAGLAQTGRLSQFMYKLNGEDEEKSTQKSSLIVNALLDLLADAGLFRANLPIILQEEQIVVAGIISRKIGRNKSWSQKEYLPVLIWFNGRDIRVKRLGETEWLPLSQALLNFQKVQSFPNQKKEHGQKFMNWVEQEIENILLDTRDVPIYLLADAALRRSWWGNFQNKGLSPKKLPLNRPLFQEKRLRIIRINHTEDVPQYEIFDSLKNSTINRNKGLFRDGNLYYSVGSRPDTIRPKLPYTKFRHPGKLLLKQQAIEIMPTGVADQAEADQAAQIAHLLRDANLTYKFSTLQPFPLHLLKSLTKYWEAEGAGGVSTQDEDDNLTNGTFNSEFEERIKIDARRKYGHRLKL